MNRVSQLLGKKSPAWTYGPASRLVNVALWGCLLPTFLLTFLLLRVGQDRGLDILVAVAMFLGVLAIAVRRPSLAVPAVFVVYVSNRLVRRLLDYSLGEFSDFPPTSLVVPALGLALGMIAVARWKTLPPSLRRGALWFALAVAYATVIGAKYRTAAVYEAIGWLSPLGFGLYVVWLRPDLAQIKRWAAVAGVVAAVAMVYGWVQWRLLPPWDRFWVANCGMGSIGHPIAGRCRFFGSFGAMGAAGTTATWAAAWLVMARALPATVRWPVVVFLAVSGLATKVRSSWIQAVAAVGVWLVTSRSRHRGAALFGLVVALGLMLVVVPRVPESEHLMDRAATLGDLRSDGSFRGRVEFTFWAIRESIAKPFGHGMGSTSLAATRTGDGDMSAFDSGYAQPFYAMGLPGTGLLILGLFTMIRPLFVPRAGLGGEQREVLGLARSTIIGFAFAMLVANVLRSDQAMLFWAAIGMGHSTVMATRCPLPAETRGFDAFASCRP